MEQRHLAVIGDIHINRKYPIFEEERVLELAHIIAGENYEKVVLAGDLFDKARPTLEEQELLQRFVNIIATSHTDVLIISGNHEKVDKTTSTFDLITVANAEVIKTQHVVWHGYSVYIADWFHIHTLKDEKADLAISHLRCNVPPHIKEEISLEEFRHNYKRIVLGDIHQLYCPYPNICYTGSPFDIHFGKARQIRGYMSVTFGDAISIKHKTLDLPRKMKFNLDPSVYKTYPFRDDNLYKVQVTGTDAELENLPQHENVELQRTLLVSSQELDHVTDDDLLVKLSDAVVTGLDIQDSTDKHKAKQILENIIK